MKFVMDDLAGRLMGMRGGSGCEEGRERVWVKEIVCGWRDVRGRV